MSRNNTMPIDGKKLKALVRKEGSISKVSTDMGYSQTAIQFAINKGRISKPMMLMLDKMYGIKYEDYKPEEKPAAELVETVTEESKADATQTPLNTATIESLLRTMSSQISHLNNNILALIEIEKQIAFVKGRK